MRHLVNLISEVNLSSGILLSRKILILPSASQWKNNVLISAMKIKIWLQSCSRTTWFFGPHFSSGGCFLDLYLFQFTIVPSLLRGGHQTTVLPSLVLSLNSSWCVSWMSQVGYCSIIWLPDIKSFWPSDTIWQQRSGSTLAQVMACCLTAPSHYLNQCWLIINKVQWHSY